MSESDTTTDDPNDPSYEEDTSRNLGNTFNQEFTSSTTEARLMAARAEAENDWNPVATDDDVIVIDDNPRMG